MPSQLHMWNPGDLRLYKERGKCVLERFATISCWWRSKMCYFLLEVQAGLFCLFCFLTCTFLVAALPVTAVTQSISTPVSSETESSGSQTTSSMAMMSSVNSSNTSPAPTCNSTPNGPHYPHSHHGMGYPMGSQGPGPGPMGNSHVMPSPGMHHPSMHNSMPPYNLPPGSMASSMLPGGMPGNMPPGGMPGNMPPGGMPGSMQPGGMSTNMPPGGMSSNMPPGGILPGNMAPAGMMNSMSSTPHGAVPNNMPAGSMPNNMPSGGMPNHMPPGSMPSSMPPRSSIGNSVNSNSMGPMNMPPQSNCAPPMPSTPDEPPEKKKKVKRSHLEWPAFSFLGSPYPLTTCYVDLTHLTSCCVSFPALLHYSDTSPFSFEAKKGKKSCFPSAYHAVLKHPVILFLRMTDTISSLVWHIIQKVIGFQFYPLITRNPFLIPKSFLSCRSFVV